MTGQSRFSPCRRYAFAFISLLIFLSVIYGNSLQGEWHLDDTINILENRSIHLKTLAWKDVKEALHAEGMLPRPLSYFTFALNYYFGELNPFGYHLINLAIHYIASVFLFLFIYNTLNLPLLKERYGRDAYSIALLATFFWAVSPMQVLAVSYVVQRMSSMAGMFYIIGMYCYLKGRTSGHKPGRRVWYILCAVAALLSFGSKENAAMLPVSIFFFDLFLLQGVTAEHIKKNIKIAIIPCVILFVLGAFYTDLPSILGGYGVRPFTLTERLLTESRVIVFYISLLLYPIHSRFAMLHDMDVSKTLVDPWTTLTAVLFIVLINGYALYDSRRRPLVAFCIIFFFLNHLLESSIIPLELIFEHRNYIPSMLFFVPVAVFMLHLLDYLSYKKSIRFIAALAVAFLLYDLGHTVYARNEILRLDHTLWLDNIGKYPRLSRPHNNLGNVYFNQGRPIEAFYEFKKASELNRYQNLRIAAISEHNMGQIYRYLGRDDQALAQFDRALFICPSYAPALYGIGMIALKREDMDGAYAYALKGLGMDPNRPELHELLSRVLLKQGRLEAATTEAGKAMELDGERTVPLAVMAEVSRRQGEYLGGIHFWKRFLEKNPEDPEAHMALIELYHRMGMADPLREVAGRLMDLKGTESLYDFIRKEKKRRGLQIYVPSENMIQMILEDTGAQRE